MSADARRLNLLAEGFVVLANEHRRDRTIGGFCTKCGGDKYWPCRIRQIADELLGAAAGGTAPTDPPAETPNCVSCGNTRWDDEHRDWRSRPMLDCDHIYCPIHGDVGGNYKHGKCKACHV